EWVLVRPLRRPRTGRPQRSPHTIDPRNRTSVSPCLAADDPPALVGIQVVPPRASRCGGSTWTPPTPPAAHAMARTRSKTPTLAATGVARRSTTPLTAEAHMGAVFDHARQA